jgi:hypothetical protein
MRRRDFIKVIWAGSLRTLPLLRLTCYGPEH